MEHIKYPEEIRADHIERQVAMSLKYWPQVKGCEGSFETHIEIPVTVHYEFAPAERETRHSPGCVAAVCVNALDFQNHELPMDILDSLEGTYILECLEEECWEDMR